MADRMRQAGQSTWYWYQLDPAEFAVEARNPEITGVSLVWKGGVDINQLGQFLLTAVKIISPYYSSSCRAWINTPKGNEYSEMKLEDIVAVSHYLFAQASYVRFECSLPPEEKFALTIWSNRDENASSLDDLQQCLGIRVMPNHLLALEDEISSLVASMSCRFFRNGTYQREAVLARLQQLRNELPEMSVEGGRS